MQKEGRQVAEKVGGSTCLSQSNACAVSMLTGYPLAQAISASVNVMNGNIVRSRHWTQKVNN